MKLDKSRELYERSKRSLAGGVSSNARLPEQPVPLFFERAKGARLYDVDGNEYIDYVMGMGSDIFGHAPDFLIDAVARRMRDGQSLAGQHELEIQVSETVQQVVPSAELVRYGSSGTEVVQAVLRLARAYTGRTKFIKFEGQYHGWMDSVLYDADLMEVQPDDGRDPIAVPLSAGMAPGGADEIIVLPWNDIEALREAMDRHHNDIAAIITEPISHGIMPKSGYLEEMRRLCDERGIVLIFDEVITGFRVALGGGQELLGVTPDMSTFAKAMAGGFPLSMFVGKRDIMALLEDGTVNHSGTMNSNVMSMAAAEASLDKLMEDDGAAYKRLYSTGAALMEGLRDLSRKHEIQLLVQGPGPIFQMAFTDATEIFDHRSHKNNADREMYARFQRGMLERGVRLTTGGIWFVSVAHGEEEVEETLNAADEVLGSL